MQKTNLPNDFIKDSVEKAPDSPFSNQFECLLVKVDLKISQRFLELSSHVQLKLIRSSVISVWGYMYIFTMVLYISVLMDRPYFIRMTGSKG
jgi:hypothetical protein